jgi:hypothetical protein
MRINSRLMRLERSVGPKDAPRRPQNDAEWMEAFMALSTDEKVAVLRSPVLPLTLPKRGNELCG